MNEINTTPLFWDCECKDDYIHHHKNLLCLKCFCNQENSPDSRIDEIGIDNILYPYTPERNTYILQKLIEHIDEKQLTMFVKKIILEEEKTL